MTVERAGERDVLVCRGCRKPKPCSCWMQEARDRMAGERDVLAEELRNTIRKSDNGYISVYWVDSPKFADAILAALAARGYTLSRSGPDGLPPGMRLVPGPVGTCGEWAAHHWTADQWGQTICAACNAKIEPIPAATPPEPAREALDDAIATLEHIRDDAQHRLAALAEPREPAP